MPLLNHSDLPPKSSTLHTEKRAFALVIALSLMAFILLLLVSLTSFVQVESSSARIQKSREEARQAAYLGFQIALGQLQQHAGADQRVTVPATAVYPEKNASDASGEFYGFFRNHATGWGPGTYLTPDGRDAFENEIEAWWTDKNPHWTAVFDSSLREDPGLGPGVYGEFDREQNPRWLISGNESLDPSDADYITPENLTADPEQDDSVVWLVDYGSATRAAEAFDGLDGRVKVPTVGVEDVGGTERSHYAFWVADESSKANFSVIDPFAGESYGTNDYWNRLLAPQRLGWENMSGFDALKDEDFNNPSNPLFDIFLKILNVSQISFLDPANLEDDPADRGPVPRNFHAITGFSKSVLADTALGGLKKDLTRFLASPGSATLSINDPIIDETRYDASDPRFGGGSGFPNSTNNLPLWGKVSSWYANTGDASDDAEVTPSTPTESGVHPIVTIFKNHAGFSVNPTNNQLNLRYYPVVMLWNPFDTRLASTTYDLELGVPLNIHELRVNYKLSDSPSDPDDPQIISGSWVKAEFTLLAGTYSGGSFAGNDPARAKWDLEDYLRPLRARITTGMEPGEILVFSLDEDVIYTGSGDSPVELANIYEDQNTLALQDVAPFGIVIPSPFEINFNLAPTPGPGQSISEVVDDLKYHCTVWNNNFENNDLLSLNDQAVDTRDFNKDIPYTTLLQGGTILFRNAAGRYNQNNTSEFFWGEVDERVRDAYDTADLPKWRDLYTDSEFLDRAPLENPRTGSPPLWNKTDNVIGFDAFANFNGLFPRQNEHLDIDEGDNAELFHRFFSVFNPSAPVWELNPAVDLDRHSFGVHNADGFDRVTIGYSFINRVSSLTAWGANMATLVNGRTRGFFFTETVRQSNSQFVETTEYPVKNVRRPDAELLSVGQLSQVNLSEFFFQPSKPAANSDAPLYVDREGLTGITSRDVYTDSSGFAPVENNFANRLVDLSYLLNESLWDRYFFSTIPSGNFDLSDDNLDNSRHEFIQRKIDAIGDARDFDRAAEFLYNVGAINVNSTSVETWVALLSAFRDLELRSADGGDNIEASVPVVSSLRPISDPVDFTGESATTDPATYGAAGNANRDISRVLGGFRYLTDGMIRSLSERIVDEVRLRGPFFSVADFVNRRLVSPDRSGGAWLQARTQANRTAQSGPIAAAYDPLVGLAGINGALQRAIQLSGINGGVNYPEGLNSGNDRVYNLDDSTSVRPGVKLSAARFYTDSEHAAGAPAGENGHLLSGAPGLVSQADILSMIGPALTARGDTFLIRTYGDSVDPLSGDVIAKVWLEAVVQRTPEYLDPSVFAEIDPNTLPPDSINRKMGRRFEVVSIRFLTEDEI